MEAKEIKERIENIPQVILIQMDTRTISALHYVAEHIEEWNLSELTKK